MRVSTLRCVRGSPLSAPREGHGHAECPRQAQSSPRLAPFPPLGLRHLWDPAAHSQEISVALRTVMRPSCWSAVN